MTTKELIELFMTHENERRKFERLQNPPSKRRDLCAFILLDKLVPDKDTHEIVGAAEHDQIWLYPTLEYLAQTITESDVIYLRRCGVFIDTDVESLSMLK